MSADKLCAPCKAFRSGLSRRVNESEDATPRYAHHDNTASFHQALELGCMICTRLQPSLALEEKSSIPVLSSNDVATIGPTTYERAPIGSGMNDAVLIFRCGLHIARLVLESWDDEPEQSGIVTSESTGGPSSLDFLVAQNKRCLREHTDCRRAQSSFIPTRLIDVDAEIDASVRLCERHQVPFGAEFIALSHCWGKSRPVTLLKSNLTTMKKGIAVADLPKTFRHAIKVVRVFKHRFIWIDSLCIIQDDPDDWRAESAQMRDVYSNAAFCIAATAAVDGTAGLFSDRDPQSLIPFKLELPWIHESEDELPKPTPFRCSFACPDAYTYIDCAPLNQRSWVAQERYLSPRILHFARNFVFWECADGITCETHPDGVPGWLQTGNFGDDLYSLKRITNEARSENLPKVPSSDIDDVYWRWCKFRALYTSFNITKESDILVALGGIAQDVGETLQDQMIAGMWRHRLLEDMCWAIKYTSAKPYRPASWRAPTWSWATSAQPIQGSSLGQDIRSVASHLSQILGVRVETNTSGDVVDGVITLKARLVPMGEQHNTNIHTILDEPNAHNASSPSSYLLLLPLRQHAEPAFEYPQFEGIIVVRSLHVPLEAQYQRIGYFRTWGSPVLPSYAAQDEQVLELV